ncbi:MAG: hypothetical protein LBK66_07255 [Spirochaetaceae bacterium]|nr:hypothetical protein [Spirochaetaceae bacterium]
MTNPLVAVIDYNAALPPTAQTSLRWRQYANAKRVKPAGGRGAYENPLAGAYAKCRFRPKGTE